MASEIQTTNAEAAAQTTKESKSKSKSKNNQYQKNSGKRGFKWRYIVLLVVVLVLVFVGVTGFMAFSGVKQHLTDGAAHFQNAAQMLKDNPDLLTSNGLNQAETELLNARDDFTKARSALGFYDVLIPAAGVLPKIGYDVSHLRDFLAMSDQAAQAGILALEGVRPLADIFGRKSEGSGIGGDKLIKLSAALQSQAVQDDFTQAQQFLKQVQQERDSLDASKLGLDQTTKALALLDKNLPSLEVALDAAVSLPPLLPDLLAQSAPRHYLVLAENDDELRPTGGFISAVGVMTVDGGRINMSNFRDSYAVDNFNLSHPQPPAALTKYMLAGVLVARDANWWPDFPTSAKQIMSIYDQDQNTTVDGVVAINLSAVQNLFGALGSVTLPDFNETLTQANFLDRIRYYYQPPGTTTDGDWWVHRKDFIGAVFKAIVTRLNGAGARDYFKLAGTLADELSQHQVQAYFADTTLENGVLSKHGLDGALANTSGDFLMVADSNVGFNKINPKIDENVSYKLTRDSNGLLKAEVTITYHNGGGVREGTQAGVCEKKAHYDSSYASMMNGCYWDYVRVYAPEGSQLESVSGFDPTTQIETLHENQKIAWANQLVMLPGASATLKYVYTLPTAVWPADSAYHLTIQKEAGSKDNLLSVQLVAPNLNLSGKVEGVVPSQQSTSSISWQTELKTDFIVVVNPK
jgi:hypothetical protein